MYIGNARCWGSSFESWLKWVWNLNSGVQRARPSHVLSLLSSGVQRARSSHGAALCLYSNFCQVRQISDMILHFSNPLRFRRQSNFKPHPLVHFLSLIASSPIFRPHLLCCERFNLNEHDHHHRHHHHYYHHYHHYHQHQHYHHLLPMFQPHLLCRKGFTLKVEFHRELLVRLFLFYFIFTNKVAYHYHPYYHYYYHYHYYWHRGYS